MRKIRILVTDDSVLYRSQIRAALSNVADFELAGTASNGRIACDLLGQSKIDLLILDLEMPEMDGLATLEEMSARGLTETKVIVFSSSSKRGAEVTLQALLLGASDFVMKPGASPTEVIASGESPSDRIRHLLEPKIRALFHLAAEPVVPLAATTVAAAQAQPSLAYRPFMWDLFRPKLVVIGSSTGGPTVLETIFSQVKGQPLCPILITQHMPPIFTATLAERLQKISGIPAREAIDGEPLSQNRIYVAPGDFHLTVEGVRDVATLRLTKGPQENFVRPAVDPLFRTAAQVYGDRCLAFVLTGMGADGKLGAEAIKLAGGAVVIQKKETCVVFGMPGAVYEAGAFDKILSPEEIVELLKEKVITHVE